MNTSTTTTTAIDNGWTNVIDAVLQIDPYQGNYELVIYRGDESEAGTYEIRGALQRAAMLEATSFIKSQGWDPVGAWDESTRRGESTTLIRRFRKATPSSR